MSTELVTTQDAELVEIAQKSGLEKALTHATTFAPFMATVIEISSKLQGLKEDNPLDVKLARECRLALVKNRTATGKQKDADKAILLAEGNLIQSLHNVIVSKSQLIESDFEAIEKAAEIKEQALKAALKLDREQQLTPYGLDLTGYNLSEMSEQTFTDLLASRRLLAEERIATAARLEAERLQNERLEAEERERVRLENIRLQAENEAKEKQLQAERKAAADELAKEQAAAAKIAADLKAVNDAKLAAIEKSNADARAKAKAEQDAKDKAAAAELAAQQANMERLAKELQSKKDAEAKAAAELLAKQKANAAAAAKAAKAPLQDKMKVWVNSFEAPANKPDCMMADIITDKFNAFKAWALTQIELI